jgi:transcription elongation factor Elf1
MKGWEGFRGFLILNHINIGELGNDMSVVEFTCPHCNDVVKLQLMNLQMMVTDKKTVTCRSCNGKVTFEYLIRPKYDRAMYKNKEWLEDQYIVQKKTMSEIGDLCGKSAMTIRDWLRRHGIPTRTRGPRG